MKQIVQNLKKGNIEIVDLPIPSTNEKFVLVENLFSLISAGTEKNSVDFGKSSLINKAFQRPDLVKQVLSNLKKEGINNTLSKVSNRLSSLTALGYSSAGVVLTSFDSNNEFKKGDRVACAGQNYASHAEFINVPQNLTVKIPNNVSFEEACFTTLGAIAMQGVRQADPKIGEHVCVIGGGLLGQITCQILNANGCNVFAIDLSDKMVAMINKNNFAKAINRNDKNILNACESFTNGNGFDKVIITAKAPTNDPIILSTEILRKKGEIIIVGEVPMEIPREPNFYKNEMGLKISCSYGPGRYDVNYEEEGRDYPYGYVRWTEKRNMEAFLKLISKNSINLQPLITHIFDIEDALKAYEMVLDSSKEKNFVGVLIKYSSKKSKNKIFEINAKKVQDINIGFIGAGNYAQGYLIPSAKEKGSLDTVVTQTSVSSLQVAKKFGFNSYSTSPNEVIKNDKINTVFIATRHDSHAKFCIDAIKQQKNVFVEKPLALNKEELDEIRKAYSVNNNNLLTVGFNRRFSSSAKIIKKVFDKIDDQVVMNFRINAGFITKDHWIQGKQGGGRVIGELCHFIDLMQFISNSNPKKIFAEHISSSNVKIKQDDNICITIKFENGSLGNLTYVANGDESLPKEYLEFFGGGKVAIINDFKKVETHIANRKKVYNVNGKGQDECVKFFLESLKNKSQNPISFDSLYLTSISTFKIIDSIQTGLPQEISF